MIGILVALTVSWILLYFIEKESIIALGFLPISHRIQQFGIGFLITAALCFSVQFMELKMKSAEWTLNSNTDFNSIWNMFFWDLKSVVTEELLFRGALLYILIKRIGASKGVLLSAIAFGVYHWFSFGIFGSIIPMIFVFIGTGLAGYAWALAFSKTNSMAMPIGFHLGWNFTLNTIFSKGPLGSGLLFIEGGEEISDWFSLVGLWVVPIIVLLIVIYFIPKENKVILS